MNDFFYDQCIAILFFFLLFRYYSSLTLFTITIIITFVWPSAAISIYTCEMEDTHIRLLDRDPS